jgi:hypothetical protein
VYGLLCGGGGGGIGGGSGGGTLMARLHWAECHSEMFSEYECWCSGSERTVFGKHSVYSRSILAVRFRTDV